MTRNGRYVEAPRIDELPKGLAVLRPEAAAMPRPPYAAGSAEAREAGRRGGRSKAGTTALASGLGLAKEFSDATFERYRSSAENFARLHVHRLAQTIGGGECGPGPASVVWSAGLQLAGSRWAFEVKGDIALGSKLANDSRQNLLAAHELCAREAEARRHQAPAPDLVAQLAATAAERSDDDAEEEMDAGVEVAAGNVVPAAGQSEDPIPTEGERDAKQQD